jgi:hypothetical protein
MLTTQIHPTSVNESSETVFTQSPTSMETTSRTLKHDSPSDSFSEYNASSDKLTHSRSRLLELSPDEFETAFIAAWTDCASIDINGLCRLDYNICSTPTPDKGLDVIERIDFAYPGMVKTRYRLFQIKQFDEGQNSTVGSPFAQKFVGAVREFDSVIGSESKDGMPTRSEVSDAILVTTSKLTGPAQETITRINQHSDRDISFHTLTSYRNRLENFFDTHLSQAGQEWVNHHDLTDISCAPNYY